MLDLGDGVGRTGLDRFLVDDLNSGVGRSLAEGLGKELRDSRSVGENGGGLVFLLGVSQQRLELDRAWHAGEEEIRIVEFRRQRIR